MITTSSPDISTGSPRHDVSRGEADEMFALLTQHFDGVSRAQFDRDLEEKNWVIQLRRDGRLVGFSTLLAETSSFEGRAIIAIYSGDTIVAPEAWGTPALARAWIATVNGIRAEHPERRCFWLLLTSGFRTYRFLPVFWREFYPRFDTPTPPVTTELMHRLARKRYGDWFDVANGIVRFPHPQRLRGPLAGVPEGRANDPHIAFFLARNPRHQEGEELVCLTEIAESNLTRAGKRMVTDDTP